MIIDGHEFTPDQQLFYHFLNWEEAQYLFYLHDGDNDWFSAYKKRIYEEVPFGVGKANLHYRPGNAGMARALLKGVSEVTKPYVPHRVLITHADIRKAAR